MKRLTALFLVLLCFSAAASAPAESTPADTDITYRTLYEQLITVLDSTDPDEQDAVRADLATVWGINAQTAGFLFEGQGWSIRGEADMQTGIVRRIICRFPYSKAGILTAYAVLYALSGEHDPASFRNKYIPDDALLAREPFPAYTNTLDAGSTDTIVFEFTRTKEMSLQNEENACCMENLIRIMQNPE